MDAAIPNDTVLVAPTRTVTAERSTLVCIVCPGCGPVLRPSDRAFTSRPSTTLRVGMVSDHHAGTGRLVEHLNSARRSRWRSVAARPVNVSSRLPWARLST